MINDIGTRKMEREILTLDSVRKVLGGLPRAMLFTDQVPTSNLSDARREQLSEQNWKLRVSCCRTWWCRPLRVQRLTDQNCCPHVWARANRKPNFSGSWTMEFRSGIHAKRQAATDGVTRTSYVAGR